MDDLDNKDLRDFQVLQEVVYQDFKAFLEQLVQPVRQEQVEIPEQ